MKDLLITNAVDISGNRVCIDDASKGQKYFCVECGKELILKISKISQGQKYYRRSHFAHLHKGDCSPETVLHNQFKKMTALFLQYKIEENTPFYISWECAECGEQHQYNLLENIDSVKIEYHLKDCRPDIALLASDGNVRVVVEVVVSHKPEDNTLKFYKENNIILVQVNIASFEDIDNLESILSKPSKVTYCLSPICEKCGKRKNSIQLRIVDTTCYRCHREMKIALIVASNRLVAPANFSSEELRVAEKYGVTIRQRYSKDAEETYFANICDKCNAFVGNNYIHEYLYEPFEDIQVGYKCINCLDEEILRKSEQDMAAYCERVELEQKIFALKQKLETNPMPCLKCGGILKIKKGKYGYFYGCCNYPDCTYTEDIKL